MLESHTYHADGLDNWHWTEVRTTENLPAVLQFWMAQFARDLLKLGVYFRAAALMAQIPGAARYQYVIYDDVDKNAPPDADDPQHWVRGADRDTVLNVLAECLRRLGAAGVLKRIPEAREFEREDLPAEWSEYLDRQAKVKCGLLNVIAECFDELIVRPGLDEVDTEPEPTWWQRLWSRME